MTEFDGPALADAAAPVNVADALAQAGAALGFLAGADWASLPGQVQRDSVVEFTRLQAWLTASRTGALLGFDAGNGYRFDGYAGTVPWLMNITRVSKGAAREQSGWITIVRNHPLIAEALTKASISDSYGKQFATWNNRLEKEEQEGADQILIEAALAGLSWDDLARVAQEMFERSKVVPDDDDGDAPFRDRDAKMERTFGGAGKMTVDLAPEAAELVQKVFDAFGKPLGPDDHRTAGERKHDALQEGMSRLVKGNMLPRSSGMDTKAMVGVTFPYLRTLPGSQELEDGWIEAQLARGGQLAGPGAGAVICSSQITPLVTGNVDPEALRKLTGTWLDAAGLDAIGLAGAAGLSTAGLAGRGGPQACGCTCGGCTCRQPLAPEARLAVSRNLLGLAIDTVSGPAGLASFLRTRQLGAPFSGQSLPLDIGESEGIPEYLRRAVIRRDGHCQFPGCWKPPAACEPHHVTPRSEGGETSLWNLKLFCWTHHHVFIHRDGWQITVHADGTVTARAPWGTVLRTNDTVAA
jgi:hypothetical protein